jgi:hypothetical protein
MDAGARSSTVEKTSYGAGGMEAYFVGIDSIVPYFCAEERT